MGSVEARDGGRDGRVAGGAEEPGHRPRRVNRCPDRRIAAAPGYRSSIISAACRRVEQALPAGRNQHAPPPHQSLIKT